MLYSHEAVFIENNHAPNLSQSFILTLPKVFSIRRRNDSKLLARVEYHLLPSGHPEYLYVTLNVYYY